MRCNHSNFTTTSSLTPEPVRSYVSRYMASTAFLATEGYTVLYANIELN